MPKESILCDTMGGLRLVRWEANGHKEANLDVIASDGVISKLIKD
jgi:hypothetical protein